METSTFPITIPGVNDLDIGSVLYCGSYRYYCLMVRQLLDGTCPFCQVDLQVNTILFENCSWRIWKNPVASKAHQALHLVIPCKRHVTHVKDLDENEWKDLGNVLNWASREFDIAGGGITMRFGDPTLNAGTIRHLHCNIQVPDRTGRLNITLAKDPEKEAWHRKVVVIYEKMRLGTTFEALTPEEQELVKDRLG